MRDSQIKMVTEEANFITRPATILSVDDEEFNLEILKKHLGKAGYNNICAENAIIAWEFLQETVINSNSENTIDVILLDRMMPKMDGIELLKKIKANPALCDIPVILQTAVTGEKDVIDGIEAGAYYYVTKPYSAEVLISIVSSAVREYRHYQDLKKLNQKHNAILGLTTRGKFELRTLEEAREIAVYLSNFSEDPFLTVVGLIALITNAIEHGNLEIGHDKKTELLMEGRWQDEVEKRLLMPEYKERKVQISFEKVSMGNSKKVVNVKITDEGNGFSWKDYMEFEPSRMTEPNGRGIAMANTTNPDGIAFFGAGNEVIYKIS